MDTKPDTRPAVVLLHSSLSSRSQWATLMAEQEANYRFIAIDLLGYGKSAFPTEAATALRLARQMRDRLLSLAVFEPVAFHLLPASDAGRQEIEAVVATINAASTAEDATRTFIDYWNRAGAFDALPEVQRHRFTSGI